MLKLNNAYIITIMIILLSASIGIYIKPLDGEDSVCENLISTTGNAFRETD